MGRRRRAKSVRGWWGLVVIALVAAGTVYFWPSSPGTDGAASTEAVTRTAGAASPAPTGTAAPSPTAATPSTIASRSARPHTAPPSHRPTTKAPAKAPAATAPPASGTGGGRTITVVNRTQETVWAIVSNTSAYPDGRELRPGQSTSLTVGNTWGGRIWGRTGCTSGGGGDCLTGDCTAHCSGANPPTTLGEFTFDAYAGLDFYDVSMVDGANLPMYINISHTVTADPVSPTGCYKGACTKPVDCPAAMRATKGGRVVGCMPPCAAFGGDTYCCRGAWAGRDKCVPSKWPVDYTQVFKKAAPYAYSYAFDDAATMACKGRCDYRVTFGVT
ncbi:thaumatin family protein [Actinacidiphila alni]|uniref:thaumatin family protein n=1 Tax=Actinacidiphila alni TaxID=380248 RepID=UPI0034527225